MTKHFVTNSGVPLTWTTESPVGFLPFSTHPHPPITSKNYEKLPYITSGIFTVAAKLFTSYKYKVQTNE
jgi:hypothetical protein